MAVFLASEGIKGFWCRVPVVCGVRTGLGSHGAINLKGGSEQHSFLNKMQISNDFLYSGLMQMPSNLSSYVRVKIILKLFLLFSVGRFLMP
jgi:hypothetical protein